MIVDQQALTCGFCEEIGESGDHLFIQCSKAYEIWLKIYEWLGFEVVLPGNIRDLYLQHRGNFLRKIAGKKGWYYGTR